MNLYLREGQFDVLVLSGPRITSWPTVGANQISRLCADVGLKVGVFGGAGVSVRGVLKDEAAGGIAFIEDSQKRVHRLEAKAIVKISSQNHFPAPFSGWRSSALIPYSTAKKLIEESQVNWSPSVAILGSGNKALRLGSYFLENGIENVYCIEKTKNRIDQRTTGWEVEKRRFNILGGKILFVSLKGLSKKTSTIWELRVEDELGVRVLEVSRIISVGPFYDRPDFLEYPVGSMLFSLEQTASVNPSDDIEGYYLESERARMLGTRIIKSITVQAQDNQVNKAKVEIESKSAKSRLKQSAAFEEQSFQVPFEGKWLTPQGKKQIQSFAGVPQSVHQNRLVAFAECIEPIVCNLCEQSCPERAIQIQRNPKNQSSFLKEVDCTACGKCLPACPSGAIHMGHDRGDHLNSTLILKQTQQHKFEEGEFVSLLNRRSDLMGKGRILPLPQHLKEYQFSLIAIEVPSHLFWDVRGIRKIKSKYDEMDDLIFSESSQNKNQVAIILENEKRLARDGISLGMAFFEMGHNRLEDSLLCSDGSCGLCDVEVDGVRQLACQTKVRAGMNVKWMSQSDILNKIKESPDRWVCVCQGITQQDIADCFKGSSNLSIESTLSRVPVGQGRCHGQLCEESFREVLSECGQLKQDWIDWRFPWRDWVIYPK